MRLAIALLVCVLSACGSAPVRVERSPSVVARRDPVRAPRTMPERGPDIIPEPEPASSPRRPPAPSTLRIALSIPLAPIREAANAAAPELLAQETHATDWNPFAFQIGYDYRATRGPIALRGAGPAIEWSTPVHFEGSAQFVGPCTSELTAHASTRLSISRDWRWVGRSTRGMVEWHQPCRVVFGLYDATSILEPYVVDAQNAMARTIDQRIGAQSLRAPASSFWAALQERVPLFGDFGLWLRPSGIGVSAITANPDSLAATLEITVSPIASSRAPADLRPVPLPANSVVSSTDNAFTVHADVEVPLTLIADELEARARAQFPNGVVSITDVRAVGGRDAIYFGFVLERPLRITAWFGAALGMNAEERTLTVSRVTATPETRAALSRIGLDAGLIETALQAGLSVPLEEQVETIQREYESFVATPFRLGGAELRMTAGRIALVDVFHTPSTAGATLAISGSASVVLVGP